MAHISAKAETFGESVIREMTRLAMEHDAVNLAQGFPDFACPPELKTAAAAAINGDLNQYAVTWGVYRDPRDGHSRLRFAFPKRDETLRLAAERLAGLSLRKDMPGAVGLAQVGRR